MPKRKGYPSKYDRKQDAKIRKLEQAIMLKQHVTVTAGTLSNGVITELLISGVPQGETDTSREGAEIHMQTISVRWRIEGSPVATVDSGSVRIMLAIDNDPRGALPLAQEMLSTDSILSGYQTGRPITKERSRGRFKFLYDETFDIINRPIASADSLPSNLTGKIFAKLGGVRQMFTDDTGDIGACEDHTLLLVFLAEFNTQSLSFDSNAVLRFTAPD